MAPRRADTTAVIGAALQASARVGYRRIATLLNRPLPTVRRWIRAGRYPNHVEWLRTQTTAWLARVDAM